MTVDLIALRTARGGIVSDRGRRWLGPGPGHSPRDRSLSVLLSGGRAIVWSFSGQDFRECRDYLGLPDARPLSRAEGAREAAKRKAELIRAEAEARSFCAPVWASALSIEGTPAESYLFRRGLLYEGDALRYQAAAPRSRSGERAPHPAMVATVQDATGSANGLHLTFLTVDGRKAFGDRSRLMFGRTSAGAVRLHPIDGDVLAVGEGIETSLAFGDLRGVPAWAALSTSGLRLFAPPMGVKRLLIAADNDDGGAGMEAARALAERAARQCAVEIHAAPEGKDWADIVEARCA